MQRVANGVWKIRCGNPEQFTPVTLRDTKINYRALDQLDEAGSPPFSVDDIVVQYTQRGAQIELPLKSNEQIYGLGLQMHGFNHTGKKRVIKVNSDPVADTGDSHAPVPFYVSSAGYGVYVDTARYVTFYCGTNLTKGSSESKKLASNAVGTSEIELYGYQKTTGDRTILADVPSVQGVDIYLFEGPTLKQAVQRYNLFSGGGCLPPYWGLGVWYRAYTAANSKDIEKLTESLRRERMPMDVLGLEPGWQSKAYSCSFSWDQTRFPNHNDMLQKLHEQNFHVNLWEHVFVHPMSSMYDDLFDLSGDFEVWEGLVPDLALKEGREIFSGFHYDHFVKQGISGFKLDECDSSDYVHSNWSFPDVAHFPSGLDGEQMHNELGVLYQSAIGTAYQKIGKRTFSQVRSSGALASSYPFVLYSDLYDHRAFIRGLVNSGFSGLLWAPEVRHAASAEDLIRRIQTVMFSPLALLNCWTFPNPPWMQVDREKNKREEFLENHQQIQDICRSLFELRMSFIPYLYSSFAKYAHDGMPPFRALVMDWPDDPATHNIDDTYMMGESVLVAPVTAGEVGRKVYLPHGEWRDFWTQDLHQGGRTLYVEPPLHQIPLFVKNNTLLPLAKPLQFISKDTVFDLEVRIYGDSPTESLLYEDDGHSFEYKNAIYNWVRLSWSPVDGGETVRDGRFSGRKYKVISWLKQ